MLKKLTVRHLLKKSRPNFKEITRKRFKNKAKQLITLKVYGDCFLVPCLYFI